MVTFQINVLDTIVRLRRQINCLPLTRCTLLVCATAMNVSLCVLEKTKPKAGVIVMHDSAKVDENALAMMVTACHASLPLAPVIGVYSFIPVGRGVKNV